MRGTASSFPDTLAGIPTARLLEVYAAGPARLREALHGLTEGELRAHPRPGKWSALEIAIHVADSELMGAARVRLAFVQPGTAFIGYDQDAWAGGLAYDEAGLRGLEDALGLFALLRRTTGRVFARTKPQDWERWGIHPEHGPMTLRNLLELYADHSERHVQQIVHLRELLGVPIASPPLLPRPLY